MAMKCKMALTSQQLSWCVLEFHKTVLWLCSELSNSNLMWIPLGVREGQSLCTSTTRNRGWAAGTITAAVNSVTPDMLQCRVRARLSHRCLPSNKRGGTLSVCDATWNCMGLWNCSHQFCKNIPVSFDFITTWNQGVFLCSPCIML